MKFGECREHVKRVNLYMLFYYACMLND